MERLRKTICLVAVLSLTFVAIWHDIAAAATKPVLVSLGQIKDGVVSPTRLDVDAAGTLYVSDARRNAVLRYDKYGKALPVLSGNYRIGGTGLAVTPDGSRVYATIATSINARGSKVITAVGILDGNTGALLGYLGGEYEFQEAGEMDLDAAGMVYVMDNLTCVVKVFNPATAKLLYAFGGKGTGQGQFWMVRGLSIDSANQELYVADPSSNNGIVRVQVFALNGTFKRLIQQASFGTPTVCFPDGIAFDDQGRGYMLESFYSDLRLFASGPTFASFGLYGVFGYEQGQFSRPYDLIYDPLTKRLFVGNDGGHIEIYGVDGGSTPVKSNVAPTTPSPVSPNQASVVASATPELTWTAATDADNDALTYNVQLQWGSTLSYNGIAATSKTVAAPLTENTLYTWRVQANDGEELSPWSATASFWVNAVKEAPSAPALGTPAVDAVLDGSSTFSWQAAADPDPFDTVSYRLEIAGDNTFAAPIIQVNLAGQQSQALKDLSNYTALVDGATYYWRVVALDSEGLPSVGGEVRSFRYDTTVLTIDATFPGAKVYLGGNLAYSGRYLGTVPVEVRDLAVGSDTLVVERAGCEPWVGAITVGERANVTIKAKLVPAYQATGHKAVPLTTVDGIKIQGGSEVSPFVIDYDRDGLVDLLTSDASGKLTLYRGVVGTQPAFAAGSVIEPLLPAGASIFFADWDNNGSQDLVVGTTSGTVQLYRNQAFETLSIAGNPINVGAAAVPVVFDYNNDGLKDLVVGSGSGAVLKYRNAGTDAAPVLVADGTLVGSISGNAAPFVADWNADGQKDLLVATSQHLFLYARQADGSYAAQSVLTVEDELVGKTNGKANAGAGYLGDKLRIFACDANGANGKDLLVGNAVGEVRLAKSFGKEYVPAFGGAVSAKLEQIGAVATAEGLDVTVALAEIASLLQGGKSGAASDRVAALQQTLPAESATVAALAELGQSF